MPCKLPTGLKVVWRPHHHNLRSEPYQHVYQVPARRYSLLASSQTSRHHRTWRCLSYHNQGVSQRQRFSVTSIPTLFLPPLVFTGLLITLWTYKCLMMIIFQNKIIYMPSMPPFSRSEKLEDYTSACKPVTWTEYDLKSVDGTALKLIEGTITPVNTSTTQRRVLILYFQGNASSLPPRTPYLSSILKLLQHPESKSTTQYTILALSYRGFWKSKGRPTQRGIELDAQAALSWIAKHYSSTTHDTKVILWGQSIGAGVATTALARWLEDRPRRNDESPVAGLLLETPFTSLNAMLVSLYPQKFLPYRYLGTFLMSTWNSVEALEKVGEMQRGKETERLKVLLLEAENDELVPKEDATTLYQLCTKYEGLNAEYRVVAGALHTDVMMKNEGKMAIVRFVRAIENTETNKS